MKTGQNWQCPYCLHFQVLSDANFRSTSGIVGSERNKHHALVAEVTGIECMNTECREICLSVNVGLPLVHGSVRYPSALGSSKLSYVLRPASMAKPQHAAVPSVLVTDYEEACAIIGLSPKASATLSRRCLQGMIRDFCGIDKSTLHAEIQELKKQVDSGDAPRQVSEESIEAIDAVRRIGNIGAHFEKDINVIVDVEPDEASALVALTELLFQEWYVARHERQTRLGTVKAIADGKSEPEKRASPTPNLIKDGVTGE